MKEIIESTIVMTFDCVNYLIEHKPKATTNYYFDLTERVCESKNISNIG